MAIQAPPRRIARYFYPQLFDFLSRLREAYSEQPFGVTSWWRSVDRNAAVGGHPYSQHLIGLAVDVYPLAGSLWSLDSALRNRGVIVVPYETHLHAQYWVAGKLEALARGI